MALFYPPPQPFVGGSQPLAPKKLPPSITAVAVDNPPAVGGLDADIYNVVLQTWVAPPVQPVQRTKFFVQSVDNPPAVGALDADIYSVVLQTWVPPPPQPVQRTKFFVQSVDNPPATGGLDVDIYNVVLQTWQPAWPRVQAARYVVQGTQTGVVDNPPIGYRPWLASTLQQWQPGPPAAQGWRYLVQGVQVDNPPVGYRPWLALTVQQWQPGPPAAQGWRYLVQGTQAGAVDNPPPGYRPWLVTVSSSWLPVFTTLPPRSFAFVPGMSVDRPPNVSQQANAVYQSIVNAWAPPPPMPQGWRYLVQGVRVDNPPLGYRPWLASTLLQWQPPVPRREPQRFLTESGAVPVVPTPAADYVLQASGEIRMIYVQGESRTLFAKRTLH